MQACKKTQQLFYGAAVPARKKRFRLAKKQFAIDCQEQYETTILKLWQSSDRESQYQALEVEHESQLSRLSIREALKRINTKQEGRTIE